MPDYKDLLRNFSIIAHIDHGKSTLADRILEKNGLYDSSKGETQVLDSMEVEKEHGITVKAQTVCVPYKSKDGRLITLNMIDTPGHVDFSYEVSRSLAACEGVLLLIDASQGIQAQTLSHFFVALEHDLAILPVINKVDLPTAHIEMVKEQIEKDLGLDPEDAILISAKSGLGIDELLEAIVAKIPPPKGDDKEKFQALVYDSYYDIYRGVVVKIRVMQGTIKAHDTIRFLRSGKDTEVEEVGNYKMRLVPKADLSAGEVGYLIAGIKSVSEFGVGDTITNTNDPCAHALAGYKEPKAYVFAGLFPTDGEDFEPFTEALHKLKLNDASLSFMKWNSAALGMGYKCGFLGLLHLEIIQERLEKEFDLNIISTVPSVEYRITMTSGEVFTIENATEFPDITRISRVEEPYVKANIIMPSEYMGQVMQLVQERRGIQTNLIYIDSGRIEIFVELPLAEIIYDFYDKLKSFTKGYASFDYEFLEFRDSEVVKMDILVGGKPVDALSQMVHKEGIERRARGVVKKLRDLIPKHMFQIPIQASIGMKIIARETISALRKDVTAKCYGGDITRKRKLLEKQKEGKKRMKMVGNVNIPQEAFVEILKRSDDE
ncbi:MAG: elongation factor 4 [Spirochaetes bacterium GWF1_51_8]|nr:MAG: elongation factor 4 [Spirochaetes bacterium GWF1_51_8]